jgi:hypothetical protein
MDAFMALGKGEDLSMVEDDSGHGFTPANNKATCAFFQKYLGLPGDPSPGEIITLKPEELNVTPSGQLATSTGGETVFSINARESQKLIDRIIDSRKDIDLHIGVVRRKAMELSGYEEPDKAVNPVFRGRYQRDGYAVEMYALQGNGNYIIPLLLFVPSSGDRFASVIYLHPGGKAADAAPGGKIEQLVRGGYLVAAPDLLGTGETAPDKSFFSSNYLISVLTGQSITGIQAGDIAAVVNFLKSRKDVDKTRIGAMAFDEMCPSLLHAAAFNESINSVSLVGSLISYKSVVMNRFYNQAFCKNYVAGALTAYDLPDLLACVAPRKIVLAEIKDQLQQPAAKNITDEELSFPLRVYSVKNAGRNFIIKPAADDVVASADWCSGK